MFRRPIAVPLGLLVSALVFLPHAALAAWPNNPGVNLPVCRATGFQSTPTCVSDGAGGAVITWYDSRGGANADIYAQHVLASGVVDPSWPIDGRALCTAANNQQNPIIIADGAGGAIVTWYDYRVGGTADIYAQHVLASGVVDPAWPVDGRALCAAAGDQLNPQLVTDGAGGAIVTWYDIRSGTTDIYAQHVLASGAVDAAWPLDGRALCTAVNNQYFPTIIADGAGGAIVAWYDYRGGATPDIYAQRVLASGAVDPAWPANGRAVCAALNSQINPVIVGDGTGGAIVTWYDFRSGTNYDIYAQHVLASGLTDPTWPGDGRAVCTAANDQLAPALVADGGGGAIITWYDLRSGATLDIYAQHVLASGAVDGGWPVDGRALCTAGGSQYYPMIVSDGAAGAIVTWQDLRGVSYDIYAQHVLASGLVDATWPGDGRLLSNAANTQQNPTIITDGTSGAIVTWYDLRAGGSADIYAQRVSRFGYLGTPEAEIVSVRDVPNDNGGKIKLSWNSSYLDGLGDPNLAAYDLYRSVPPNVAAARLARGERAARSFAEAAASFDRLLVVPANVQDYYWEFVTTVSAMHLPTGYSYLVPTAEDSTGYQNPKTTFMVAARNAANTIYWFSRPDSGYSVDNLPPLAPAPFAGQYNAGVAHLHWSPNSETDLANYRLYRGTSAGFTPSPGNRVATPTDTLYDDVAGNTYYYKLSAIDTHGNESGYTALLPGGTTDVTGGASSLELALQPAAPNPASTNSTLRYTTPREAPVALSIYDAGGRLIRTLASGVQPAGQHQVTWDLRDAAGHAVGAGLYLVRLEVEGRSLVRRMTAMR